MDKQTMKLGLLAGAAVLSLAAGSAQAATDVCTGKTAASSASVTASSFFVTQGFSMNCSANVVLSYDEDATAVGVCAASNKGNTKYGGTTKGGSVSSQGTWSSGDTLAGAVATGC